MKKFLLTTLLINFSILINAQNLSTEFKIQNLFDSYEKVSDDEFKIRTKIGEKDYQRNISHYTLSITYKDSVFTLTNYNAIPIDMNTPTKQDTSILNKVFNEYLLSLNEKFEIDNNFMYEKYNQLTVDLNYTYEEIDFSANLQLASISTIIVGSIIGGILISNGQTNGGLIVGGVSGVVGFGLSLGSIFVKKSAVKKRYKKIIY